MGYMSSFEKSAEVRAIRSFVKDLWQGSGVYAITDSDGTRTVSVCEKDDLVWEVFHGWWPCDSCEKVAEC